VPAVIRVARGGDAADLAALIDHYITTSPATFDLEPLTVDERSAWLAAHPRRGPHRVVVAVRAGRVVGFASSGEFRRKAGYATSVECSVYCAPDATGAGLGTGLYAALFAELADAGLHRAYAAVALPNPASVALHLRSGFHRVGVLHEVGWKFGRYWDVAWFERPLP